MPLVTAEVESIAIVPLAVPVSVVLLAVPSACRSNRGAVAPVVMDKAPVPKGDVPLSAIKVPADKVVVPV